MKIPTGKYYTQAIYNQNKHSIRFTTDRNVTFDVRSEEVIEPVEIVSLDPFTITGTLPQYELNLNSVYDKKELDKYEEAE